MACGSRSTSQVRHVNPTCGDEIDLRVPGRGRQGRRRVVRGHGLLDQPGLGQRALRADGRADGRRTRCPEWTRSPTMMGGRGQVEPDEDVLEDGVAFAGVAKYPARVKCALLSWMAFKDATVQATAARRVVTSMSEDDRARDGPAAAVGRRRGGHEGRGRPRARHQRGRPRPGLRRPRRRRERGHPRHDADLGGLPAHRRHRGPDPRRCAPGPAAAWSATSGSTGSGCRRGDPTRSPTRAASSCARSASTSEHARAPC